MIEKKLLTSMLSHFGNNEYIITHIFVKLRVNSISNDTTLILTNKRVLLSYLDINNIHMYKDIKLDEMDSAIVNTDKYGENLIINRLTIKSINNQLDDINVFSEDINVLTPYCNQLNKIIDCLNNFNEISLGVHGSNVDYIITKFKETSIYNPDKDKSSDELGKINIDENKNRNFKSQYKDKIKKRLKEILKVVLCFVLILLMIGIGALAFHYMYLVLKGQRIFNINF